MSYWGTFCCPYSLRLAQLLTGYKFETLSLIPDQWNSTPREFIESREEMVVNNHAQYCSVVRTGIGKARLVIGGEVDARKSSDSRKPLCAVC